MSEKITMITLTTDHGIERRRVPSLRRIAGDDKRLEDSCLMPDEPHFFQPASRVGLKKKPYPIVIRFEGDAEGVDIGYGPAFDFRSQEIEVPEYSDHEETPAEVAAFHRYMENARTSAEEAIATIGDEKAADALRRADLPKKGPGNFPWMQGLVIFLCLAAVIMVMGNGGVSLPEGGLRLKAQAEEQVAP